MPSIINASSSGSGGIVQTADASGVLQLQSNGTTVLTATGSNIGISNTSPQGALDVGGLGGGSPGDLLVTTASTTAAVTVGRLSPVSGDNTNFRVRNRVDQDSFFVNTGNRTALVGTTFGVGGATPATSGAGITFPATQSASSNANTLDDYEEGTWTPVVGGNATYLNQEGGYVKIGRFVWLKFLLRINVLGTGSTTTITGLPFAWSNDGGPRSSGACNYFNGLATSIISISWNVDANGIFAGTANGSTTAVSDGAAIFGNGTYVMGSVTYIASS